MTRVILTIKFDICYYMSRMLVRVLIIVAGFILVVVGTYLIHWLLNAQEWVDIYVRKIRPDLLKERQKGKKAAVKRVLKRSRTVVKAVGFRNKFIEFLAKDKPQTAPVFIYIIMSSFLTLTLLALVSLGYVWSQLV